MDELTRLVKETIKGKYINIRRFSDEVGIPQTTIISSIKHGVGGTAFNTVMRMCKALNIKLYNGIYPMLISDAVYDILRKMVMLDEKGIHAVKTVVELEYLRTKAEQEHIAVAESFSIDDITYQQLNQPETPSINELSSLLKAINDADDVMSEY